MVVSIDRHVVEEYKRNAMIIECPECGTKNTTDKPPQLGKRYRCGKCGTLITFTQTADTQGIFTEVPPEKAHPKSQEEVKRGQVPKKRKGGCLGCLGLIAVFIIIGVVVELSSSDDNTQQTSPTQTPAEKQAITENPRYIYEDGAIHVGGDGEPIELINNTNATNPTYAELVAFITEDTTDSKLYRDGSKSLGNIIVVHVCADFAEEVHNNAEAKGIRAAWVGIDFRGSAEGHALNAFETTDRGLVYVDCTGEDTIGSQLIRELKSIDTPSSWDKIAYVEVGKVYGGIYIDNAESPSYDFYEAYTQKWQECEEILCEYNDEVLRYNQETEGKIYYIGSSELAQIETWEARLEEQSQLIDELIRELGGFFPSPMGIVENIFIRW